MGVSLESLDMRVSFGISRGRGGGFQGKTDRMQCYEGLPGNQDHEQLNCGGSGRMG